MPFRLELNREALIGQDDQSVFLNLFWFLPEQNQSITASADASNTSSSTSPFAWDFFGSPPKSINGINSSLGVAVSPHENSLTSELAYKGYRANIDLSNTFTLSDNEYERLGNTTRLKFSTAIIFADGHFGWSRPVSNSFALVIPNKKLRDQLIGITLSGDSYTARVDRLGSAVVPELQPYKISNIQVDAPNLPLGYDLGPAAYKLLPSYKSGTLIRIGSDGSDVKSCTQWAAHALAKHDNSEAIASAAIGRVHEETYRVLWSRLDTRSQCPLPTLSGAHNHR